MPTFDLRLPFRFGLFLTAAGRGATAATASNRNFRSHPEARTHTVGYILDCYILCLLVKILIYHHGKTINLEHVITFFWFIQNHCKRWTRSATCLEEDPDGSDLLFFEIILQNGFGFL